MWSYKIFKNDFSFEEREDNKNDFKRFEDQTSEDIENYY